jgi:hypothetical protein
MAHNASVDTTLAVRCAAAAKCPPSSEATNAAAKTVVAVVATSSTRRPRLGFGGFGAASFRPEYFLRQDICGWRDRARRAVVRWRQDRHVQDDRNAAKGEKVMVMPATSSGARYPTGDSIFGCCYDDSRV